MTTAVQPGHVEDSSVGTIVGGGFKIGLITTIGVVVFALVSRPLTGMAELVVQSLLLIAGGVVFAFWPAIMVGARSVDGLGWASLLGLMGALFFTVADAAVLRPIELYHWSWDAIGGGSGFWYIPVWWMGSSYLAGFGGLLVKASLNRNGKANIVALGIRSAVIGLVIFAAIAATGLLPATSATVALGFALAVTIDGAIAGSRDRGV